MALLAGGAVVAGTGTAGGGLVGVAVAGGAGAAAAVRAGVVAVGGVAPAPDGVVAALVLAGPDGEEPARELGADDPAVAGIEADGGVPVVIPDVDELPDPVGVVCGSASHAEERATAETAMPATR